MSVTAVLAGASGAGLGATAGLLLALERRPARDWARVLRTVGGPLGRRLPVPRDAGRRLAAAGLAPRLTPEDLRAARGTAALLAATAVVVAVGPLGGSFAPLLALVAAGLAMLPDVLLDRRIRTRRAALARELPDALDLLRVAVRAGLPPLAAVTAVGAAHEGVAAGELRRVARQVTLGRPFHEAVGDLEARCPADRTGDLVALLRRAHRHGASAAPGLQALAADLRARRARDALDRASRAAPKVQLAVALLLVPAVLLVVAAVLAQQLL